MIDWGKKSMFMKRLALLLVAALFVPGCGGGDGLKDISGTVSLKGKAVPKGMIWFDPAPDHPSKPVQGYAFIEDGKFDSKAKGRGVAKGPYLVRVEAYDGKSSSEFPYGRPLSNQSLESKLDISPDGNPLAISLK
ncbi:MAG: hypothetical protein ACKO9Z_10260 [Planctomycetota bacterium]